MNADRTHHLITARRAAGFKSARAAALSCGWVESTYSSHENGTRDFGIDDAEKYAEVFRARGASYSAAEIIFGPASRATPLSARQEIASRIMTSLVSRQEFDHVEKRYRLACSPAETAARALEYADALITASTRSDGDG